MVDAMPNSEVEKKKKKKNIKKKKKVVSQSPTYKEIIKIPDHFLSPLSFHEPSSTTPATPRETYHSSIANPPPPPPSHGQYSDDSLHQPRRMHDHSDYDCDSRTWASSAPSFEHPGPKPTENHQGQEHRSKQQIQPSLDHY